LSKNIKKNIIRVNIYKTEKATIKEKNTNSILSVRSIYSRPCFLRGIDDRKMKEKAFKRTFRIDSINSNRKIESNTSLTKIRKIAIFK